MALTEGEENQLRQLLEEIRTYKSELADLRIMLESEKAKSHPSDEMIAELRMQIKQLQEAMSQAQDERKAIRERTDEPDPAIGEVKVTGNEFLGF
jgi:chromosome segregation ATPase